MAGLYENTHTEGGDVGMGGLLRMDMMRAKSNALRTRCGGPVARLMRACTSFVSAALFTIGSLCPRHAQARNESGAEMLFQAGRDAMARGDLKEACLKFKESNDVAPAPGTVLNLGNCEEQRGRIATAWEYFTQAMGMLEPLDPRYTVAERRAQALEKLVPRLVLELSPTSPSATRVYRSGVAITTFGQPVRLDPGEHTITVEAPGYSSGEFSVTLLKGETKSIVVSPGEHIALPSHPTPVVGEQSADPLPWVILGTGAVGLVGASVLGSLSYVRWNTVQKHCDLTVTPHACDAAGLDAQSEGKTMGVISAGLGLVAVASVVLYFTLPTPASTTVSAGHLGTFSGVQLSGEF